MEQYESATSGKRNNCKVIYGERFWCDGYRLSSTVEESENRVPKEREMF